MCKHRMSPQRAYTKKRNRARLYCVEQQLIRVINGSQITLPKAVTPTSGCDAWARGHREKRGRADARKRAGKIKKTKERDNIYIGRASSET